MDWQSIETAPKDATEVLLYSPDWISIGYFLKDTSAWWIEGGQITGNPTHWMPLPNPPKEEK